MQCKAVVHSCYCVNFSSFITYRIASAISAQIIAIKCIFKIAQPYKDIRRRLKMKWTHKWKLNHQRMMIKHSETRLAVLWFFISARIMLMISKTNRRFLVPGGVSIECCPSHRKAAFQSLAFFQNRFAMNYGHFYSRFQCLRLLNVCVCAIRETICSNISYIHDKQTL